MKSKYLIRLDDACPTMDKAKWQRMEDILCRFGVRPLVGIIPNNEDPETSPDPEDSFFWEKAHKWENAGWTIALHGYNHVCTSRQEHFSPSKTSVLQTPTNPGDCSQQ